MYKLMSLALMALLLICESVMAQPVTRVGKEWIQPAEFSNLTRFDVGALCPLPDGFCSGTLDGVDLTGVRWASAPEVLELFQSYGTPAVPTNSDGTVTETGSVWAPAVFVDFNSILANSTLVEGWTRTEALQGQMILGVLDSPDGRDQVFSFSNQTQDNLTSRVWLYREAAPPPRNSVPVPSLSFYSLMALLLGLVSIAVWRLRPIGSK